MSKGSEITNGYLNLLKKKVGLSKEEVETIAKSRTDICINCGETNFGREAHCRICNCFIPAKARCMECKCPEDKWTV